MPNKWAEFVYTKGFKLRLRGNFCDRMASNWLFHFVQCRVLVWDLLCRRSHWLYLCFFLRILGMVAMDICHCKPDMIFSTVTVGGMQSLCRKVCWVAGNLNAHCSQFSHDCPSRLRTDQGRIILVLCSTTPSLLYTIHGHCVPESS